MSIQVDWDDAGKTLICVTFNGPYSWPEYDAVTDQIADMMKSSMHSVDVIIMLDKNTPPPQGDAMQHFRRTQNAMPGNLNLLVTVGAANAFTRILFATLIKVRRIKVNSYLAGTEEEARAIIAQHRQHHP